MQIERREFVGHLVKGAATAALLAGIVPMVGCSAASDIAKVLALLPTIEGIAQTVATVIAGIDPAVGVPIQTALGLITTAFSVVESVISTYKENIAGIPQSVLADLDAAIAAIQTNISNIENLFPNLSVAVKAGITIGLEAFNTILKLVASLIPAPVVAAKLPRTYAALSARGFAFGVQVTVIPSRREFAQSYNSKMDAAGFKKAHIHVPWVTMFGIPVAP
jgi:hypothetical protein